jgi:F-type H+-transporting ATPase subunit a
MFAKLGRRLNVGFLLLVLTLGFSSATGWAQHGESAPTTTANAVTTPAAIDEAGNHSGSHGADAHGADAHDAAGHGAGTTDARGDAHGAAGGHDGGHEAPKSSFAPHAGTIFNPIARAIFGQTPEEKTRPEAHEVSKEEIHYSNVDYDYLVISFVLMGLLGLVGVTAAKKARVRPEGKPHSLANAFEAAVEGFQNYLIGVMGESLARKYTPLIASFFFTILLFNWIGLVPGWLAPTSNPNVPFALAIVSFFMVHIIAIKETGIKSWFMHFVGEPKWMAPLMFPLHIIGELVKPASLALRLLGNVFGEEVVIAKLIGLSILATISLPFPFIPLQLPILLLSVFFGLLQAMVFSTLLAIYIAILGTHHDDHDAHNEHGHVEHTRVHGHHELIAHPSEATIA